MDQLGRGHTWSKVCRGGILCLENCDCSKALLVNLLHLWSWRDTVYYYPGWNKSSFCLRGRHHLCLLRMLATLITLCGFLYIRWCGGHPSMALHGLRVPGGVVVIQLFSLVPDFDTLFLPKSFHSNVKSNDPIIWEYHNNFPSQNESKSITTALPVGLAHNLSSKWSLLIVTGALRVIMAEQV